MDKYVRINDLEFKIGVASGDNHHAHCSEAEKIAFEKGRQSVIREYQELADQYNKLVQMSDDMQDMLSILHAALTAPLNIQRVIVAEKRTIVLFDDGTKTMATCQDGDTYSLQTGLMVCMLKRLYGNRITNELFHCIEEDVEKTEPEIVYVQKSGKRKTKKTRSTEPAVAEEQSAKKERRKKQRKEESEE